MTLPCLSYKEWHSYSALLNERLAGARLQSVYAPSSAKNEWVLEFYHEHQTLQLLISLIPQAAGSVLFLNRPFKKSNQATRSVFDLTLEKRALGLKVVSVYSVPGERCLEITFQNEICLHLNFLPAKPMGVLTENGLLLVASKPISEFVRPTPREIPDHIDQKIPMREEMISSLEHYAGLWLKAREDHKRNSQLNQAQAKIDSELKTVQNKLRSLEVQHQETIKEPDYQHFGKLLQIHFHERPAVKNGSFELFDFSQEKMIQIPADEKLSLRAQLERYFHLAKRKEKRLIDTSERIEVLKNRELKLLKQKEALTLDSLPKETPFNKASLSPKKRGFQFSGKQYTSAEGLTILVGRNKTENLELTFKIAKGNDLWLHVKGKPSAHAVILLPPGRTASLETLLDAANLLILHSGGKEWGKTQVDYTPRKNVKKIKNQSEVSYLHPKTLWVDFDELRVKRLFQD